MVFNPYPAHRNHCPICKELGSGWDAEYLGFSPASKLFEIWTIFSPTLSGIEALWKLKQTRNVADDNLFGGLVLVSFTIAKQTHLLVIEITLSQQSTTKVPYAKSLDPDETPGNSAPHPDPSCLTPWHHFHQRWATLKTLWKLKQTRNLADDNLFGGLKVKMLVHRVRAPSRSSQYRDDLNIRCKELGSGWDAEYIGISSGSKQCDTRTHFSPTLNDF